VRKTLNVPGDLVGQVERRRGDVEAMVDDAIERALRRLRIPSRHDMDSINQRLDELSAELKKLNGSAPAKNRSGKRRV
jgi:polyhydroxyalkanoate synthesis regulator phasin